MKKIFVAKEDHRILAEIIQPLTCRVLVFGSRIKGTQQKFSDLDLCLKAIEPISLEALALFKEALSDSDLPFIVDVVDYYMVSEGFQKIIDKEGVNFLDTIPA